MAFVPFGQIETISPRRLLLIAGSEADTLYFSQNAYEGQGAEGTAHHSRRDTHRPVLQAGIRAASSREAHRVLHQESVTAMLIPED